MPVPTTPDGTCSHVIACMVTASCLYIFLDCAVSASGATHTVTFNSLYYLRWLRAGRQAHLSKGMPLHRPPPPTPPTSAPLHLHSERSRPPPLFKFTTHATVAGLTPPPPQVWSLKRLMFGCMPGRSPGLRLLIPSVDAVRCVFPPRVRVKPSYYQVGVACCI